jgi:DNA-binding SARP family transcriptional activator
MISKDYTEAVHSHTKAVVADGWAKYHLAHELLEQSQWSQVLALLAQAESIFSTFNETRVLRRALIGQALLHWRDGMTEVAEARGLAALQAAEATDDGFAVGYVTWQLANLKIDQEQYAQAADYFDQAQLTLDAVGLAPAGGVIAAAAQLCHEILRWQQMCERQQIGQHDAEAAIAAIRADLSIRIRRVGSTMQVVATQAEDSEAPAGVGVNMLPPMVLPPAELPSLPWIGLSIWLGRLWHKLIHGDEPATARRVLHVPIATITADVAPPIQCVPAQLAAPHEPTVVDHQPLGATRGTEADLGSMPAAEALATAENGAPQPDQIELPTHGTLLAERVLPKVMSAPFVERVSLPIDSPPAAAQIDIPAPTSKHSTTATLTVRMFGSFRVVLNDCEIENWPSGRGRAIFKYLLTHRDRPLARDVLMEVFWPEVSPESARNSLNVALHGLRQALRAADDVQVVVFQNGMYRLNPELQIQLDVEEFKRCLQLGRRSEEAGDLATAAAKYEQAAQLYQGDFMADDLADDWPVLPRERLRVDYLDTLDRLSHMYFTDEQYSSCITLCQMILAQDNCREDVHCRLMRCYSRQNQHPLALRQYQACLEALERELGVVPAATTTQVYERIRRREAV